MNEEYVLGLPKRNNYHYEIMKIDNISTAVLHYKLNDKLFEKHINYCEEKGIIPQINTQWVHILIDNYNLEKINGWSVIIQPCHVRHARRVSEYWQIFLSKTIDKKQARYLIHRFLLNPPENMQVDHINHNTFDNRVEMLKIMTNKENNENRRGASYNSKSGIRGISLAKIGKYKYWRVVINSGDKVFRKVFPYNTQGLLDAKQEVIKVRKELFTNSDLGLITHEE